jgi:hypothetical protein
MAFEMAALDALRDYKFHPKIFSFIKRYTLVFKGIDNKAPEDF